ncbi:MAG: membrane protein insertion efficiency factor YidD [Coxiellaceae bacterium]|nr:membrane protein insertion efficiency factor YidD [Coxiellaceae bacterium]
MGILSTVLRKGLIGIVSIYQWVISPWIGPSCRFTPSCSEYAKNAIEQYGCIRGGGLALVRLSKCHPFGGSGHDPVIKAKPEKEKC